MSRGLGDVYKRQIPYNGVLVKRFKELLYACIGNSEGNAVIDDVIDKFESSGWISLDDLGTISINPLLSDTIFEKTKPNMTSKRIVDFIEGKSEEVDMNDAGTYQQAYAVQAIGSGQLYGKGLNNNDTSSLKNAGYIAEAQNDFIFAVIGEELGFTGSCITIFLLFLIVLECIIVAVRARNFEGRLICCGVAIYIGFQTFINIGVVSWILPNTGVPLPFFSCGITSLLTLFIAMGIVLNVSLQRNVERDDDMFADDFRG